MKNLPTPAQVFRSAGFYPLTALYLTGVVIVYLIANGVVTLPYGIFALSLAVIFALVFAAYRELKAVHRLVNGQREELIARIDELNALLTASGVVVPPPSTSEERARADSERDHRGGTT